MFVVNNEEIKEKLVGLVEAWRDDAANARDSIHSGERAFASCAYDGCADDLEAEIKQIFGE